MADAATIQARIDDAETAYNNLMLGMRTVSVSVTNGVTVEYSQVDAELLRKYIDYLKSSLQLATTGLRRRPIYFEFGR